MDAFKILPSESSVNNKSKKERDRQTDIIVRAEYISFGVVRLPKSQNFFSNPNRIFGQWKGLNFVRIFPVSGS